MRCERLALARDDAAGVAAEIRKLVPPPESVRDGVALIIATVRTGGDRAVRDYSRTLDTGGREPQALLVPDDELDAALARARPGGPPRDRARDRERRGGGGRAHARIADA